MRSYRIAQDEHAHKVLEWNVLALVEDEFVRIDDLAASHVDERNARDRFFAVDADHIGIEVERRDRVLFALKRIDRIDAAFDA